MGIKEIEVAITRLSASEFVELAQWFENYQMQRWDRQIETDLEAGRLDALLAEVNEEYDAGLAKPL
jgi:hypothetical protein